MKKLLVTLITTALLLTACEQTEIPAAEAAADFSGPTYRLKVADINTVVDYVSPHRLPNVEYLSDITPVDAVRRWLSQRVVVAGRTGLLEVDIEEASIVKKDIPKQKHGIEGIFTKEQTEEYDGKLEVTLKIYSGHKPLPVAHLDVSAHLSQTLQEDATLLDRKRLYHDLSVNLMRELDKQLDDKIRHYFVNYLL